MIYKHSCMFIVCRMVISCNFNELHISGQDQQIPIYFNINIDNNNLTFEAMHVERMWPF